MKTRWLGMLVLVSSTTVVAQQPSADWPQWRGPNRDGSTRSFTPPASWPASLTERWRVEVGLGYSSPLVIGDRVFVFTRQGEDEVLMALDAANGSEIWASRYPAPYEPVSAAARHGKGPKSTPVHADGKLFTFGISGILSAWDAATGKRLWQHPAPEVGPMFTTSQSPIYDRGLLITHVGGNEKGALTAFDPNTGKAIWQWTGEGAGYGSPVVAEIGGVRQVITVTWRSLVGVSAETGELLWQRPFRGRSDVNAITPLISNDVVYVSAAEAGLMALRIVNKGGTWAVEELWRTNDVFFHLSNFTLVDGALYGLSADSQGRYAILDAKTGAILWAGPGRAAENASFLNAGNLLLVLEGDGDLLVADAANRAELKPIQQYKVGTGNTWAAPAVSRNRIFVRNDGQLVLFTVN
ncbi:MAG: PQQ-binding-like beta-propeller repeat protein [Vicinamibacterales bacterium]